MMTKVSVLTVSQSESNIKDLLRSLESQSLSIVSELLISWNGDQSLNVTSNTISIRVVNQPYNFSANNNSISALAETELICFINDDVELDIDCLMHSVPILLQRDDVGVVGINLRYPSGMSQHGGILMDDQSLPYHRFKGKLRYDDPRLLKTEEVQAVTGAFMLLRLRDFKEILFDERCIVAAQDVILCLEVKRKLNKKTLYVGRASALHRENDTRKKFDQKETPIGDMKLLSNALNQLNGIGTVEDFLDTDNLRLRIVTEKEGWILHRKAHEIATRCRNAVINEDYPDANLHYYINYGYFNRKPVSGITVANFTHYDPILHADKWVQVAHTVDFCVAVSEEAKQRLLECGVSSQKIAVIMVGADVSYQPALTLGICGRIYPGGRKGDKLVQQICDNNQLMQNLRIISFNEGWPCEHKAFDSYYDFYSSIDFLLIPSLLEGGPVPFMEALACGKLSIAPNIGVVPSFPHIQYNTGDIDSLTSVIERLKSDFLEDRRVLSSFMRPYNWSTWACRHIELFNRLLQSTK
jgi:GT2 family glycosyltransferase